MAVVILSAPAKSNRSLNGEKRRSRETQLDRLTPVPRVHHGDLDDVIPLRASQQMVQALEKADADVTITRYPDLMHDSWSAAYSDLEVYRWMFRCERPIQGGNTIVPEANNSVIVE